MEIVFWVMLSMGLLFFLIIIKTLDKYGNKVDRSEHHDSMPGSYYEISNRKEDR